MNTLKFNTNRPCSVTAKYLEEVQREFNNWTDEKEGLFSNYFNNVGVSIKNEGSEVEMTFIDNEKVVDFQVYMLLNIMLHSKLKKGYFEDCDLNLRFKNSKFEISINEFTLPEFIRPIMSLKYDEVKEAYEKMHRYHEAFVKAFWQAENTEDFYRMFTQETTNV